MASTSNSIVFLALGSLGDLLPLLAIARRIAQQDHDQLDVVVVTHAQYLSRLHALLHQSSNPLSPLRLVLRGIPTPPLPLPNAGPSHVQHELDACLAACRIHTPIALLAFNLVAKFGIHLAELLSIPSYVLLHPSLAPPSPEPSLAYVRSMLGANLFKMMLRVEESEERFKEMTHWMLSLFLPVYHTFRERHGLCPCISSPSFQPSSSSSSSSSSLSLTARLALTGGTPLLYGVSEFFFPKPGYWPKAAVFCGAWRWEEEDVREGKEEWKEKWMPSEALQRFVEGEEGKEDTEATTCALARKGGEGEGKEGAMALPVLPASLPRPPLICLDMGSCVEVGLRTRSEWEGLIEGVVEALRRAFPGGGGGGGREGGRGGGSPDNPEKGEKRTGYGSGGFRLLLLHFPPSSSLGAEVALEKDEEWGVDEQQQQQQQQQQQKLTCDDILRLPVEEYVPHSWLFPRCHLVLHHGGLGSTMACIGARGGGGGGGGGKEEGGEGGGGGGGEGGGEGGEGGGRGVPQLVLPCTEEQRVWGERVAYLGIGAVMGREGEQDGGIEEAVYQALKGLERGREICLKTIRRYAGWLREEDGVGRAVEVLMEEMSRRRKKRRKEEEEEEEEEEEGEEE